MNTAPALRDRALAPLPPREAVARRARSRSRIAFVGAALIAFGDWTGSPGSLLGNGLALAGAVTARRLPGRRPRPARRAAAQRLRARRLVGGGAACSPCSRGRPASSSAATRRGPGSLFTALAVVPTLGGHGLVNKSPALAPRADRGPLPPRRAGHRLDPRLARLRRDARGRGRSPAARSCSRPSASSSRGARERSAHRPRPLHRRHDLDAPRPAHRGGAARALRPGDRGARPGPSARGPPPPRGPRPPAGPARHPGVDVAPPAPGRERPRRPLRARGRDHPRHRHPRGDRVPPRPHRRRARSPSCCAGRCARSPTPAGTGRRT